MKTSIQITILFSILSLLSCDKNEKFIYTSSSTFSEIIQISKNNNKGIILLLGSEGCSLCDGLLRDINNDESLKKKIEKDYIYARINKNTKDGQWLCPLLERGMHPVYFIFDKNQHLKAYLGNYKSIEELKYFLNLIKKGHPVVKDIIMEAVNSTIQKKEFIEAMDYAFQAQILLLDPYNKANTSEIESLLSKSLSIHSNTYVQYLAATFYATQGDSIKSNIYAYRALDSCNAHPEKVYQYALRLPINKLINPSFDIRDEAYLILENDTIDIGIAKLKEKQTIRVPFFNDGNKGLALFHVRGDCSCTSFNYSKDTIPPGDKRELIIYFTPDTKGEIQRDIMIVSNSLSNSYLTIKGIIQ